MTDEELKQQPRSVREEFSKIQDAQVDGDAKIVAMLGELETKLIAARATMAHHDKIIDVIKWIPFGISSLERQIGKLKERRVAAIAKALIEEEEACESADFAADDALIDQLAKLERDLERLQLSLPGLQSAERKADREQELAGNPCVALEDQINHRRDWLKLAEARRRHGY